MDKKAKVIKLVKDDDKSNAIDIEEYNEIDENYSPNTNKEGKETEVEYIQDESQADTDAEEEDLLENLLRELFDDMDPEKIEQLKRIMQLYRQIQGPLKFIQQIQGPLKFIQQIQGPLNLVKQLQGPLQMHRQLMHMQRPMGALGYSDPRRQFLQGYAQRQMQYQVQKRMQDQIKKQLQKQIQDEIQSMVKKQIGEKIKQQLGKEIQDQLPNLIRNLLNKQKK